MVGQALPAIVWSDPIGSHLGRTGSFCRDDPAWRELSGRRRLRHAGRQHLE